MEQNGNQNMPPATLCRAGCGFYANATFDGMCSKCYKDALKRRQNSSSPPLNGRSSPSENVTTPIQETCSGPVGIRTLAPSGSSVETASPTVPILCVPGKSTDDSTEEGATAAAPALEDDIKSPDDPSNKKPKKNRCHTCKKKVGLTGFECRCGGLYCGLHRYSDKHNCSFDYREMAQEQIRKNNPVIVGEKIQKI
ncbi:AN1-type zinc finger protein 5-like isoform X2 [Liolophura sinensis]|uniref:AN1-type zinc finger protein 5-like isoform X2 n=1 Tax=Liolophura sinensis TaxID=3198878 RepID=UPI0031588518